MPIKQAGKKALRQTKKHRILNVARQNAMKNIIKKIQKLATTGKKNEAQKMIPVAYQAIDKVAKRGIIKKNAAARKKSGLMRLVK